MYHTTQPKHQPIYFCILKQVGGLLTQHVHTYFTERIWLTCFS